MEKGQVLDSDTWPTAKVAGARFNFVTLLSQCRFVRSLELYPACLELLESSIWLHLYFTTPFQFHWLYRQTRIGEDVVGTGRGLFLKNYPILEGLRKGARILTSDNIPGSRVEHRTPEYEAVVLSLVITTEELLE
jgi:hypothetical protein